MSGRAYFRVVAKPYFILQAVTDANHARALNDLLTLDPITWVLVSVAYLREEGLAAAEEALRPVVDRATAFVGIRNDLTSIQAVRRLLSLNVELYAVDTATKQSIYHPKLYIVANNTQARAIVGSANLTFGGMYNNIEVSAIIELDCANPEDAAFLTDARRSFENLLHEHPEHVFQIRDSAHADQLFDEGRLADETVIPAPKTGSTIKKGSRDSLRPMKLNLRPKPKPKIEPQVPPTPPPAPPGGGGIAVPPRAPVPQGGGVAVTPPPVAPAPISRLIWVSTPLKRRDLNIPTASGTNPTGSMGWTQGIFEDIEQRHYFRDQVFNALQWTPDPRPNRRHLQRASANFELIIKGVNYGIFNLRLSHNTDTNSRGYRQNNFMTQVHWGPAKAHVAKEDLLGRRLYLYRKDTDPPEFVIEID
jgi:HKD family nuclease